MKASFINRLIQLEQRYTNNTSEIVVICINIMPINWKDIVAVSLSLANAVGFVRIKYIYEDGVTEIGQKINQKLSEDETLEAKIYLDSLVMIEEDRMITLGKKPLYYRFKNKLF